jgi:hypothetical protein
MYYGWLKNLIFIHLNLSSPVHVARGYCVEECNSGALSVDITLHSLTYNVHA